ncbi:MAG: L-threonylcarbamoyladenylate synthase [bacterium]
MIINYPWKADEFEKIIKSLLKGDLIAFPTDTVYAIAALSTSKKAVKRLYKIKKRQDNKPTAILIGNKIDYKKYTKDSSQGTKKIINAFWPGALTLVLRSKSGFSSHFQGNSSDFIGIRHPSEPLIEEILVTIKEPLVASSSNTAGEPPLNTPEAIDSVFGKHLACIIRKPDFYPNPPSTIVKIDNNKFTILREGAITRTQINQALDKKENNDH